MLNSTSMSVHHAVKMFWLMLCLGYGGLFAAGQAKEHDLVGRAPTLAASPNGAVSEEATVTYRDEQLTIDAQNARLASVLELVSQKSGVSVRIPLGSGSERIFEHFGPCPIRSALAHLLTGSSFNFVIISSPQRNSPQEVLLTLRRPATSAPQPSKEPGSPSVYWEPPDKQLGVVPLSAEMDDTLEIPNKAMTPQELSEFMREKQRELREKNQQLYPQ